VTTRANSFRSGVHSLGRSRASWTRPRWLRLPWPDPRVWPPVCGTCAGNRALSEEGTRPIASRSQSRLCFAPTEVGASSWKGIELLKSVVQFINFVTHFYAKFGI
jgi:hypothetical protein